jgi:hypothetical protein
MYLVCVQMSTIPFNSVAEALSFFTELETELPKYAAKYGLNLDEKISLQYKNHTVREIEPSTLSYALRRTLERMRA